MQAGDGFRVIDLLLSESFRLWVLEGKNDAVWKEYLQHHPDQQATVDQAAAWVNNLCFTTDRMEGLQAELLRNRIRQNLTTAVFGLPVKQQVSRLMRYAAILLLLIGVVWASYRIRNFSSSSQQELTSRKTVIAPPGKTSKMLLSDGSVVTLNAGSMLSYPVPFKTRQVKLKGEAYFEVSHDEKKPFSVLTEHTHTTVLGTSFNVNARGDNVQIALVKGKLNVENIQTNNAVMLNPGEMLVAEKESETVQHFDHDLVLGWKDQILVYQSESLKTIFSDLERVFGVRITLKKGLNTNKKYTGRFEREPLDSILKGIGYVSGFSVKKDEYEIIIFPK